MPNIACRKIICCILEITFINPRMLMNKMEEALLAIYKKVGSVAGQVREEAVAKCVPGATYVDVLDWCEARILELGGNVAWAQMNPTTTAAHFCPTLQDNPTIKEGDLLKLDLGVHIDGYLADTAISIQVDTTEYSDLIKASQNGLKAAIKIATPGTKLSDIGAAQYSEAEALGFTTVKNLCGHTLGQYEVHSGISIPSFDNGDDRILEEDMTIAIEPFVTNGEGFIKESGEATIFMQANTRQTRSPFGRKVFAEIKKRNGLPVTNRDFKALGSGANAGLKDLLRQDIIRGFPPLIEVSNAPVAQSEHSIIVGDKPIVYTEYKL
jgi:methionyl aminopeptidase